MIIYEDASYTVDKLIGLDGNPKLFIYYKAYEPEKPEPDLILMASFDFLEDIYDFIMHLIGVKCK